MALQSVAAVWPGDISCGGVFSLSPALYGYWQPCAHGSGGRWRRPYIWFASFHVAAVLSVTPTLKGFWDGRVGPDGFPSPISFLLKSEQALSNGHPFILVLH